MISNVPASFPKGTHDVQISRRIDPSTDYTSAEYAREAFLRFELIDTLLNLWGAGLAQW